jgi:hypothetical protein
MMNKERFPMKGASVKTIGVLSLILTLVFFLAGSASAGAKTVTTVVTRIDANAAGDGYIVATQNGTYALAYGAGGYGKWDEIYSLILDSMQKKKSVTLVLGPDGIEDARPAK